METAREIVRTLIALNRSRRGKGGWLQPYVEGIFQYHTLGVAGKCVIKD